MSAPFAALEARVNTACMAALANAEATLPSAVVVSGIFDNAAVAGGTFDVAPGFIRRFIGLSASLSALTIGQSLTIGGVAYAIAEIEPDGTGLTSLSLK